MGEHKRKVLICQALIKCADISNPSRPYDVSKHWVAALESEWTNQLLLEQHLHLPATVKPSDSSLGEAKGQVWFITTFVRPLFALVAQGIHALEEFSQQCRNNLAMWEARSAELAADARSSVPLPSPPLSLQFQFQLVENFLSAFPPTLPDSFRSREDLTSLCSLSGSPPPSSSGSSCSNRYLSCESGPPSPFEAASPLPSPAMSHINTRLEITTPSSGPASVTSVSSHSTQAVDATAAIRAAYKAGPRKKKSWHRSSWSPTPTSGTHNSVAHPGFGSHAISPPLLSTSSSPLSSDLSPMTTHSLSPLTPLDSTISNTQSSPMKETPHPGPPAT